MTKLPGFTPAKAGLEQRILRKLPALMLWGTLLLAAPALLALLAEPQAPMLRYAAAGLLLTHVMLVLLATLLCLIVVVMKGHAWVADAYSLPDSERPARPVSTSK